MRTSSVYLGLLSLFLVAGCDFDCPDCDRGQPLPLFEGSVELTTPSSAVAGDTFTVSVRAHPRISGTGYVHLVGQAHLLRTIAPVQDSIGCFRAENPSLCSNVSLATDSARVVVDKDQTLVQTWRLILEEGSSQEPDPLVSAVVKVDSVRSPSGTLYSVHSREGRDVLRDMHGGPIGMPISRASTGPIPIPLRSAP